MALAVLFLLATVNTARAQSVLNGRTERKLSDRWSSNSAPTEPQRLFVVIEANAGKKATDIQQIVRLGLEYLRKERRFDFDDIKIQPVSSSLYRGIRALFQGTDLDTAPQEAGPSVRLLPGGQSVWEVGTGSPFSRAKSLTVYFEKDEDGKVVTLAAPETFATAPALDHEQPFRFHSPGLYLFAYENRLTPTRYEIELVPDAKSEGQPTVLKANWPQDNLYYLLSIEKFSGDRRVLFDTLKNNRVVGNGLKDVQTVESATISLATFIDPVDTGTSGWDDARHYHVRIKKPDDKFPKRAWMLFPLTPESAAEYTSQLTAACNLGADDRKLLLETIRGTAIPVTDQRTIDPVGEPTWYEIPAEERGGLNFSRVFQVADFTASGQANQPTSALTIFEFNDEVILSVGNSYVLQLEHPRWLEGLHRLATQQPSN